MFRMVIALLFSFIFVSGCSGGDITTSSTESASNDAITSESSSTSSGLQLNYSSVEEAIKGIRPLMSDTVDDISTGAAAMAIWSSEHLLWSELQQIPKTKVALVMKDSDEERGKAMCIYGTIIEIAVERANGAKYYHGGMYGASGNIYRFIAVKSTGDLVANSSANFCGIVIGKQDYSNSMGGVAHAVFLVGMFKLPENEAGKSVVAIQ